MVIIDLAFIKWWILWIKFLDCLANKTVNIWNIKKMFIVIATNHSMNQDTRASHRITITETGSPSSMEARLKWNFIRETMITNEIVSKFPFLNFWKDSKYNGLLFCFVFYKLVRFLSNLEAVFRFLSCTYHKKGKLPLPELKRRVVYYNRHVVTSNNTVRET